MKARRVAPILALATLSALAAVGLLRLDASDRADLAGTPEPELFGEGVLSTSDDELGAAFTPDGKTIYFTLRAPPTTTPPLTTICVSHLVDAAAGRWSEPEIAPFSGRFNDSGPAIS